MKQILKADLKKLFCSYRIYMCMFGLDFVFTLSYIEFLKINGGYIGDFTNGFQTAVGNEIKLICFLICIVGGSFLYCTEERHGYIKFEIQRVGVNAFTLSKLLTSLIGGFMTAMVGIVSSMGNNIVMCYATYEDRSYIWPEGELFEVFVWEVVLLCMLCGLLSTLGFLVTTFYANYYIAMAVPILVYFAMGVVSGILRVPYRFQIAKVFFPVVQEGRGLPYFAYALLYTSCCLAVFYIIARRRI